MEAEYAWLTSPLRAGSDKVLGPAQGLPLPFLLRHGVCTAKEEAAFALHDVAESVLQGKYHFYLAATDPEGVSLDLTRTFFIPEWFGYGMIVVGSELLRELRERCDLSGGRVVPLDRSWVSAHAWTYSLPRAPESMALYERLAEGLGFASLPSDTEIVRRLCDRYPAKAPLPQLHLVLPPWFGPPSKLRVRLRAGRICVQLKDAAYLHTANGEVPVSADCLRSCPMVSFNGFLVPLPAAGLFETREPTRRWPTLTRVMKVRVEV